MAKRRGSDAVRGGTSGGVGGERNYGAGALASRGGDFQWEGGALGFGAGLII